MTRVWLPGRARLRTACRSGNQRDARDRAHGADDARARRGAAARRCRRTRAQTISAHRAATPPASRRSPTSAAPTSTAATTCVQSMSASRARMPRQRPPRRDSPPARPSPAVVPPRSSSSGLTRRTSSSGTSENSSETSRPTLTPCHTAEAVRRIAASRRTRRRYSPGSPPAPARASADAQHAPGQPEHDDLQHVGGEHLPRRRADALQDRDALDLLPHEHARDAPHADAAEHEDHEADQAQVVLGAERDPRRSGLRSTGRSAR